MLRGLLLVSALTAMMGACSPAEPPLLIDGGEAPASDIGQGAPPADPSRPADEKPAASR